MSQTRLALEACTAPGSRSSGSLGAFSAIPTGTVYCRRSRGPGGYALAMPRATFYGYFNLVASPYTPAATYGKIQFWIRPQAFPDLTGLSAPQWATIINLEDPSNGGTTGSLGGIAVDDSGNLKDQFDHAAISYQLAANTGYTFEFCWHITSGHLDEQLWITPDGGSRTKVLDRTNLSIYGGATISRIALLNYYVYPSGNHNNIRWSGQIGAIGIYSLAAMGDAAIDATTGTVPLKNLAARTTFYVSSTGSNVTGDGTVGNPLGGPNFSDIMTLQLDGTIMGVPAATSWLKTADSSTYTLTTDIETVDTDDAAAVMDVAGDIVILQGTFTENASTINGLPADSATTAYALHIGPPQHGVKWDATAATFECGKLLTSFTQPNAGTYPNVWQSTDATKYCGVFMNGGYAKHVKAAAISSNPSVIVCDEGAGYLTSANYNGVLAAINANPGSFWVEPDGSKLYFSYPTGMPAATIHRSITFDNGSGSFGNTNAVYAQCHYKWIGGTWLHVGAINNDGTVPTDGYALYSDDSFLTIATGMYSLTTTRHFFGGASVGNNGRSIWSFTVGAGNPNYPNGGMTHFVRNPNIASTGNQELLRATCAALGSMGGLWGGAPWANNQMPGVYTHGASGAAINKFIVQGNWAATAISQGEANVTAYTFKNLSAYQFSDLIPISGGHITIGPNVAILRQGISHAGGVGIAALT